VTALATRPRPGVALLDEPHAGVVIGYARISQDGDGRGLGVARQVEDIEGLAAILGYAPASVVIVIDNDESASAFAKKPRTNWPGVVERIERGEVSHVLAYSLSRLTRDIAEREELLAFRRHGVSITTRQGQRIYPGMSAMEVNMIRQMGNQDTYESEVLSERITRAFVQNAAMGVPHGPIAYGWDRHRERDGRVVDTINDAEAGVIREVAARMVDTSESTTSIVRDLNDRGVPAPRGGKWSPTILRKIMLRERNVARRVHQGVVVETTLEGGRAAWDPIYDDETHAAVVAHLNDPGRFTGRGGNRYLLSGLLVCGKCGSDRMWIAFASKSTGLDPAYACKECHGIRRKQAPIDEFVTEALCARLARPDALDWSAQDAGALRAARANVERLRGLLAERVDMLDAGDMSRDEFVRSSTRLRSQIAAAEAAVEAARPVPGAVRGLVGLGTAEDVRAAWDLLSLDAQRDVVRTLVRATIEPTTKRRFDPTAIRLDWLTD
jgi:DNA invertase Pin-like site-specific DNA recombinase